MSSLLRILVIFASLVVLLMAAAVFATKTLAVFGAEPKGELAARIERSPHHADGVFHNLEPTHKVEPGAWPSMLWRQFFGDEQRIPPHPIAIVRRTRADYAQPPATGLRATWLGHATVLLELDGQRVLVDPIFSARCSPFSFAGPERFFPPPITLSQLPHIDAVAISHDHYDHLDMPSVVALARAGAHFFVPLGIGAHLERWGVPRPQITDLDWYESARSGTLQLTATPARHYSGRGLLDGDHDLWASWAIVGPRQRVFFSGDSGYSAEFARIGERFGPFDLTLIKIGASDPSWHEIHMSPEDAVRAHRDVRGKLLLPVHWGTFNLAYHDWNEPAERLFAAANAQHIAFSVPRPGEFVEPGVSEPREAWWR